MPLINFVLIAIESCVLTSAELGANADVTGADGATFKISGAKLYVPVVTLLAEDNVKLVKQLNKGFKRPAYWNKYKVIDNKVADIAAANAKKTYKRIDRFKLSRSQKIVCSCLWFFSRVEIENYNIEIDGRNFYDQQINDSIKQYDKVRKVSTGQGDDYATGCLLDFAYFEKNYRLIAGDLSKEKVLDADSRAVQQIVLTGKIKSTAANTRVIIYYILNQSKETIQQFSKEKQKFCN